PRRKAQSGLIVAGLMLATLISAASLTVGDTLNHSVGSEVYGLFDEVDEIVVAGGGEDDDEDVNIQSVGTETIPGSSVDEVRAHADDLEIDAVGSFLTSFAPAINVGDSEPDASNPMALFEQGTASEPSVGVVAAPQQTFDDFNVQDTDGNPIDQ